MSTVSNHLTWTFVIPQNAVQRKVLEITVSGCENPNFVSKKLHKICYKMSSAERQPLVVDNGSYMCKAGYSGDDKPCSIFPSTIVGVTEGTLENWEKIWHHTFYEELKISPDEHPVFLSNLHSNTEVDGEKIGQVMFETFNVPYFYVAMQPVLSLYANGETIGMVVDSGYEVSQIVPVHEGFADPSTTLTFDVAGRDLTDYMTEIISKCGLPFAKERKIVRNIKETLGCVALDFTGETNCPKSEVSYQLPDGKSVMIGNERFMCPEALFQPSLLGKDSSGLHETIHTSLMQCNDIRKQLLGNIVLAGESMLFPGLSARLKKELKALVPNHHVNILAPMKHSTWIGGSILSSLSTFQPMWITRQEYDESGPSIVKTKCS